MTETEISPDNGYERSAGSRDARIDLEAMRFPTGLLDFTVSYYDSGELEREGCSSLPVMVDCTTGVKESCLV